jgi:hypothetical protein
MREAYRAVERGVFDLDIIFQNSVTHRLSELPDVFTQENTTVEEQASLKTIIIP